VQADYAQARRKLGVVPQELVFDPFFNVREALRFQSGYFGIQKNDAWIDELLDSLGKSAAPSQTLGIVYKDAQGNIHQTLPRPQIKDLGLIPWPDYELLETEKNISNQRALDSYFFHSHPGSNPRVIDMISSRSCPYSCTFCFHPVGKTYRERPLDDFFAELDMVVTRYDVNMVAVIDELFSLRQQRLLEFCTRIKPYNLKWMVQLHVSSAKEDILRTMREAGCTYISYGIESMSRTVLDSMKKKTKPERIAAALALTYEHRIGIQGNLLFGDKAETLDTANESMHWWAFNRHYQINLTPLMVFPGSPDYYEALRDGLISDREAYVASIPPRFNISQMSDENLEMIGMQVWVHQNTLLNMAPLKSFAPAARQAPNRDTAYDIIWDCPECQHTNEYLGVVLPPDHSHTLRLTCRNCLSRWDIENKAHNIATNATSASARTSLRRITKALFDKIRQGQYRDIVNKALALLLSFIPGKFRKGKLYEQITPPKHLFRSFAAALGRAPLNPEKHNDFADILVKVGAHGAARMHYQQALALDHDNARAKSGLSHVDGPQVSDLQRATYFISWSDAPPPARKIPTETVHFAKPQGSTEPNPI
jgi:hypothetical protein